MNQRSETYSCVNYIGNCSLQDDQPHLLDAQAVFETSANLRQILVHLAKGFLDRRERFTFQFFPVLHQLVLFRGHDIHQCVDLLNMFE